MLSIIFAVLCIFSCNAQDIYLAPFIASMKKSENFVMNDLVEDEEWQIAMALYTSFRINYKKRYQSQPRIPKIIHQIWLGSELPEDCKFYAKSLQKNHPEWEYKLWTEKDIDELCLVNRSVYDASHNYGEKSDIARYEILYRFGGVYLDTDFECVKPLDMLHHCTGFYTGIGYSREVVLCNGLIGCSPGHPIMKKCIDSIKKPANTIVGIFESTGPIFFTKCFFETLSELGHDNPIVPFPVTFFYPWPNSLRFEKKRVPAIHLEKESFALHYWRTSWVPK